MHKIDIKEIESNSSFLIKHFLNDKDGINRSPFNIIDAVVYPQSKTDRDQHLVKEYWFIKEGKGKLIINDSEVFNVSKGELLFFDSMISHEIYNESIDQNLEFLSIWW
jgi:mannose-6-phosphate isomerase-like protein (cupin superfamily)